MRTVSGQPQVHLKQSFLRPDFRVSSQKAHSLERQKHSRRNPEAMRKVRGPTRMYRKQSFLMCQ